MDVSLKYLLDTNICIYIANHRPPEVLAHFNALEVGEVGMSIVTYGELHHGAMKSQQRERAVAKLDLLVEMIPILPLTDSVGRHYGEIRSTLEQTSTPIGNNDLWIAAHARDLGLVLVSNNMREFIRVPKLQLENWLS